MSKGYIVPDVNTFPPPPEPAPTPRTDWAEARVWARYKQAEDIASEDNARAAIREVCEHASTLERELTSAQAALAAAEKAIRKGSEDALYMRDDLLKQLAAAQQDKERLLEAVREDIISANIIAAEVRQAGVNRHGIDRDIQFIIERCRAAIDAARKA